MTTGLVRRIHPHWKKLSQTAVVLSDNSAPNRNLVALAPYVITCISKVFI
jgi:hypothetical protein